MASDWEYIDEHLGGHDGYGVPNFLRGAYEELDSHQYKTMFEWNEAGRVVKKGNKGKSNGYRGHRFFHINDTELNSGLAKKFILKRQNEGKKSYVTFRKLSDFTLWLLRNRGSYIYTRSKTWQDGILFDLGKNTLFILIRKRGIDIKLLEKDNYTFNEEHNNYSFKGGKTLWLDFSNTTFPIYYFLVKIVKLINNGRINEAELMFSEKWEKGAI